MIFLFLIFVTYIPRLNSVTKAFCHCKPDFLAAEKYIRDRMRFGCAHLKKKNKAEIPNFLYFCNQ